MRIDPVVLAGARAEYGRNAGAQTGAYGVALWAPALFVLLLKVTPQEAAKMMIAQGGGAIVNVGSIGQPRDRNPKASYVTFDLINNLIELHRVEYDVSAIQSKIRAVGLPESLAERLTVGR